MAALPSARVVLFPSGTIKKLSFPLPAGFSCQIGSAMGIDSANPGAVYPMAASTTLTPIGSALQAVTGSSTAQVGIELDRERNISYWDNATGGNACTVANSLGVNQYFQDDHTITTSASGNSHSGRVWIVNAAGTGQVGIEMPF